MRLIILFFISLLLALPHAAMAQRVTHPMPSSPMMMMMPSAPATAPSSASNEESIAAVVNDAVVSSADVRARTSLALLTSNLPDTADIRQKLLPQVLRGLIDEQLQLQEGKRLDITITPDDLKKAMDRLAQTNSIPGGDMAAFLSSRGVPPSTILSQARAALTWNKVVQRELRPRVDIGDDEIDSEIARIRSNAGKEEFLVSEIYLSVDNPKDEEQVKSLAERLAQQIKSGATFGAVARQFSQNTSAASGGDIGWIQAGQLSPELDKALLSMQAGEIAGPVRTTNGFHILGVREKRTVALGDAKDMNVDLQQAFLPFTPQQDKEVVLEDATKLRQTITSCDGLSSRLKKDFPAWHWQDLGHVKLAGAPSWLTEKVRNVSVGHSSEAMATDKGALILFVCGRTVPDNVNREEIMASIGTERIELLARRLIRDLRRDAYIDVRMTSAP